MRNWRVFIEMQAHYTNQNLLRVNGSSKATQFVHITYNLQKIFYDLKTAKP